VLLIEIASFHDLYHIILSNLPLTILEIVYSSCFPSFVVTRHIETFCDYEVRHLITIVEDGKKDRDFVTITTARAGTSHILLA
jgi:hypothetical protein